MSTIRVLRLFLPALAALFFVSCDSGGSSDSNGGTGTGVILCLGDSITEGTSAPAGAPYPTRLAALTGRTVINEGRGGQKSFTTAANAPGLMDKHQPSVVCLMIGANDATAALSPASVGEHIRSIIKEAKARGIKVVVGTITPTAGGHEFSNDNAAAISEQIRVVVKQEGVRLVDISAEFGTGAGLLQDDGLHPNDAGTELIAQSFFEKL
jgi:acyl-CoA thioesterase I